ncbi:hypothetical protein [Paenibacillus methanolicus]|uniref:Uncharacterized protein n=1 Tax=Paenibacillus methanolicus TaxID=582686 RepID=A0A5S5C3H6_9BACL|nr:hypothetical protein [Paenibacillus methanolicus]TYP73042.1 hypothetical protein BCM02_10726 [Paenibacillus methanolicus]
MANTIDLKRNLTGIDREPPDLYMSNGATSLLLDLLALSGSDSAIADREKEFIIWLNQRDQSVVGIGTVSFSIDEMPWTVEDFHEHKAFLLSVIDRAANKHRWSELEYVPAEESALRMLKHFRLLIDAFQLEDVDPGEYAEWSSADEGDSRPTIPVDFPKCAVHRIYLSCHGCLLCNQQL